MTRDITDYEHNTNGWRKVKVMQITVPAEPFGRTELALSQHVETSAHICDRCAPQKKVRS